MKRKALSSAVYSRLTRAVCLADLGRVVQSKFAAAILKRERTKVSDGLVEEMDFKRKSSNGELENFKVCLRHHRDALRETTNFLQSKIFRTPFVLPALGCALSIPETVCVS